MMQIVKAVTSRWFGPATVVDEKAQAGGDARSDSGSEKADEHALALRRYLFYFLIPFWFVPGVADWYWHRKTKIEDTSGTHESLTHALMMAVVGVPITAALLFEINALVIATLIAAYFVHEGITYWDVRYANGRREVPTIEQHTHSFLEMLPFVAASVGICLSPKQFEAMFGRGREQPRWYLEPKRPPLSAGYVAAVLGSVGAFVALPYAEEFVRCFRVDHTVSPHPVPPTRPDCAN
jgi:hypothetical protein